MSAIHNAIAGVLAAGAITIGSVAGLAHQPSPTPKVQVSKLMHSVCMAEINGTRAEYLATPKAQRVELDQIDRYCDAIAIASNPGPKS